MSRWIALIASLPTENATVRMRVWRSLKASGAAVLRDGVYLLPASEAARRYLYEQAAEVQAAQGAAWVVGMLPEDAADFVPLFDRSPAFGEFLDEIAALREHLPDLAANEALRRVRRCRKHFAALAEIDFFPGEAQAQAAGALETLEQQIARLQSPDEPQTVDTVIARRVPADYHGRRWATRQRPWVDRLASAWLIRRFIDPAAQFVWLARPEDCPAEALGFDFDGATFTHVAGRVSFEVLLASFGLETPPLQRLGALVHYLDVGGVQPPEAAGIESTLAGLRAAQPDDDRLLDLAGAVFDGLYTHFSRGSTV